MTNKSIINKEKNTKLPYSGWLNIVAYGILFILMFFVCVPIIWLLISSFRSNNEFIAFTSVLPQKWTLDNYIMVFEELKLGKSLFNSLRVGLIATGLVMVVASMAAYVLTRFEFRFKNLLFSVIMWGLLIPTQALFIPTLFIQKQLNLYDTFSGIVLVYAAFNLPISIFILKGCLVSLPKEIEEAADIDGCSNVMKFIKIVLPLLSPGLFTVGLLCFVNCWNEFLFAVCLTGSEKIRTLQVTISFLKGQFSQLYTPQFAAVIVSILPALIIFLMFQEKVIDGLAAGAVKG